MHRLAATPGGWNPQQEGVIFIQQTPATLVFLTAADTDIQTLAQAIALLPPNFPTLRVVNLLQLQQQLTIDTYAEEVLESAQVIVLRLLGGRAYWSYGLEVLKETVKRNRASLIVLPGDDRPDPELLSHSTVPLTTVNHLWRYLNEGGITNMVNALQFVSDACLGTDYHPLPPQVVPQIGLYGWQKEERCEDVGSSQSQIFRGLSEIPPTPLKKGGFQTFLPFLRGGSLAMTDSFQALLQQTPKVGLLFYRAHY
ncbi:MAG: cobaltochelatase subunit CobN, partial [Leptolyngbyaceae bacterium]|nr:cobaltochelatase subunit CobN [Leptolyngbyaceae bacterium]